MDYIPKDLIQNSISLEDKWRKLIREAFQQNQYVIDRAPRIAAKVRRWSFISTVVYSHDTDFSNHLQEDIVIFAQLNWPMMFSRFFESVQSSGPELSTKNVIIGINWTGMFFISEQEEILVILIAKDSHHRQSLNVSIPILSSN